MSFYKEAEDVIINELKTRFINSVATPVEREGLRALEAWRVLGISPGEALHRAEDLWKTITDYSAAELDKFAKRQEDGVTEAEESVKRCKKEYEVIAREIHETKSLEIPVDLSLIEVEKHIRGEILKVKEVKDGRMKKLSQNLELEANLLKKLVDVERFSIDSRLVPEEKQLNEFYQHILMMKKELAYRQSVFDLKHKLLMDLFEKLEVSKDNCDMRFYVYHDPLVFVLSKANISVLKADISALEEELKKNELLSSNLDEAISSLYARLEIPEADVNAFKAKYFTYFKPSAIEAKQTEIERLQVLKQANMEKFIEKTREEISSYYEKCYVADSERENFPEMESTDFGEALVEAHEQKLADLKARFETHKTIYNLMSKLERAWERQLELDIEETNPQHLLNTRGGALLKAQQERSRVQNTVNKTQEQVIQLLKQYKSENNELFAFFGLSFAKYAAWKKDQHKDQLDAHKTTGSTQNSRKLPVAAPAQPQIKNAAKKRKTQHNPPPHPVP